MFGRKQRALSFLVDAFRERIHSGVDSSREEIEADVKAHAEQELSGSPLLGFVLKLLSNPTFLKLIWELVFSSDETEEDAEKQKQPIGFNRISE